MTGSGLFDFLIACVGLCIVVYLFFLAIDFISPDPRFRLIARVAVGGLALLIFLLAVKAVLFGGGGSLPITPMGVVQFAVGIIVVLVVVYLIGMATDFLAPPGLAPPIKFVVGAIGLIAIMLVAKQTLLGGNGIIPASFQTRLTK